MGIVPITQDISHLVRTMLVNATYGSEAIKGIPRLQEYLPRSQSDPETVTKFSSRWQDDGVSVKTGRTKSLWSFSDTTIVGDESEEWPDQPRLRFWIRRIHDAMTVTFVVIFVTGFLGNCRLIVQRDNPVNLRANQILRYLLILGLSSLSPYQILTGLLDP